MFFQMDLHTLPDVRMMGQVGQRMGYANHAQCFSPHILILVREGSMSFRLEDQQYDLTAGMWVLLPEGGSYQVWTEQGCMYAFIHFQLDKPLRMLEKAQAESTLTLAPTAFPYTLPHTGQDRTLCLPVCGTLKGEQEKIWAMLTECDIQRQSITPSRKLGIDLRFAEMLTLLDERRSHEAQNGYPSVLSRILRHIHEHYAEPLTLASLGETFQLSRQYIMRLFQKHLHTTVTHYITQLKMRHALELLRHSNFRINEVSDMLGYRNTYYFCRVFHQHFGMTPTEYIRHGLDHEA